MLTLALPIAFTMVILAMVLNLWRLTWGPSLPDRILAFDTLAINTIALVMLYDIALESADYFESALTLAVIGFVSTAALCKFLLSGNIIE